MNPSIPLPPTASMLLISSSGSRLRTVTGRTGSAASRIPKSPENLARGGYSSVATESGNSAALASVRPASSRMPSGSSTRNWDSGGNGPWKDRDVTSGWSLKRAGQTRPSWLVKRAPRSRVEATGAEKSTRMSNSGIQARSAFTLWQ